MSASKIKPNNYRVTFSSICLWSLFAVALISICLQYISWPSQPSIDKIGTTSCEPQPYVSRIVSYDPLIIHLENFITLAERAYLASVTNANLKRSTVASRDGGPPIHRSSRTSSTAFLPHNDTIGQCIQKRAADFQGFLSPKKIEMLQVVQYKEGQEYRAHYDWGVASEFKAERESTIFGILEGDCEKCGTQFPKIAIDWTKEDPRWCDFVECDILDALTFKATAGSAVFWKNLHVDGTGDLRTFHAGLPVGKGTKLGLNIWTIV
ncbi:hypothetical protein V491_06463 [Pseudogymnoascus sp. VKM F-3775]|nr:hypothetical protein V491_06463 [Pseudogymnoascus sp. VKM F-3775]